METIRGRSSREMDVREFTEKLAGYNHIALDLGTGDGRFARRLAERHPGWFVIGADACRENLHEHSRARLANLLFVIASAERLPQELRGLAAHITINFPWGSLLGGLLAGDPAVMDGLQAIARPAASIEVRLNGGALAEAGYTLESGADRVHGSLLHAGWVMDPPRLMDRSALRAFPSTWARRLAAGRDPRTIELSGSRRAEALSLAQSGAMGKAKGPRPTGAKTRRGTVAAAPRLRAAPSARRERLSQYDTRREWSRTMRKLT